LHPRKFAGDFDAVMNRYEGASMEKANIIGVDLAKHLFQVHGACSDPANDS
jgi:hypothetical protein